MNEENNKIKETANKAVDSVYEGFAEIFKESGKTIKINGRTLYQWLDYFKFSFKEAESPEEIRKQYIKLLNKSEELYNLISLIKVTYNSVDLEEYIHSFVSSKYEYGKSNNLTKAKRFSDEFKLPKTALKKVARILLNPLEEQKEKLNNHKTTLETVLMSMANEIKYLR